MTRVTADDIIHSIGAQPKLIVDEIIRTGVCRREWRRAVAFVLSHTAVDMAALDGFSPRVRRLIDLLSVADPIMLAYGHHRAQAGSPIAFANAA